jgi:hypothetical protein
MSRIGRASIGLLACLAAAPARAAEPEKRPLPDYDGRGGTPQTPGQKALWVPRILLSPLYFVSEFVVRRPLGFAITAAEKANLPAELYDFFAFGPDHKAGIVPIAFIDFGFEPSVGLYGFWDDAGFKGHQLRLHGSTWGPHWLSGTATERFVSGRHELGWTVTSTTRPDYAFYGLGPDTRESDLMRYSSTSVDARVESRLGFAGSSLLEVSFGYRGQSFGHSRYDEHNRGSEDYQASVDDEIAAGHISAPPGFRDGFRAPVAHTRLVLDSRARSQAEGGLMPSNSDAGSASGVRLELLADQGVDLKNEPDSGWLRYGGTAGGFVDIGDSGRVVSLSVSALLADPLGDRPVPFTEQVALGGPGMMPGFRMGRLYGRSAAVATLRYSWPIWIWLNGTLQVATGNVFGARFDGFRAERARLSTALGIESLGSRDSIFQALIGFGSETFESGGKIDSLRVVVGARSGF